MVNVIKKIIWDDSGVTAVEYGLLVALIAVGAVVAMHTMGQEFISILYIISDNIGGTA